MNNKSTRKVQVKQQHHNVPAQTSDSGLTGKQMSIYTKRRQGEKEGDTNMEKERERNRERKINKGKNRRRERRKEKRRKRFHCATQ